MTRGELTRLLHQPHLIDERGIGALDSLIHRYPYCQTFHILKTKGMHNVQSLGYMEQLKLSAITVSDRKNLYELIMRQSLLKQIEEVENNYEKAKEIEVVKEIKKEISEPKKEEVEPITIQEIIPEKTEIPEVKKEISLSSELKEKVKFETYFIPETPIYLREEKSEIDLTSSVEKSIPLEEIKFEINSKKEELPIKTTDSEEKKSESDTKKISGLEQEILYEAINKSIQNEVWGDIVEENPDVIKSSGNIRISKGESIDKPKDFMSWLHLNDTDKKAENEPFPSTPLEEEKEHPSVIPKGQVKNLDELIDKFIRSDPRITPSKAEFYSPTNIAKLSIIDQEEFVSETLAKIYEKQGYFDKAIKVYQKLSLKFPEKNSYFASLIEKTELQKAIDKQKKQK